jgi:hypothetical protein
MAVINESILKKAGSPKLMALPLGQERTNGAPVFPSRLPEQANRHQEVAPK